RPGSPDRRGPDRIVTGKSLGREQPRLESGDVLRRARAADPGLAGTGQRASDRRGAIACTGQRGAARAVRPLMGTSNTPLTVLGAWRIIEMELWDREAMDLMGPALMEFGRDQTGLFRFIAVEGCMDCRHELRDGRP